MTDLPEHRDTFGLWLNRNNLLGEGVEVGCGYCGWSDLILSQWQGRIMHLVDCWMRQPAEVYREKTDNVDYSFWKGQCVEVAKRHEGRCSLIPLFSLEASKLFADGQLDFAYLDGNHDHVEVAKDINAWWPKVKSGGMFAGHDFYDDCVPPKWNLVKMAVEIWAENNHLPIHTTPCTSFWIRKP